MTDIPRARELIDRASEIVTQEATMARHGKSVEPDRLQAAADYLEAALPLMTRRIIKRAAPSRRTALTAEQKVEIRELVRQNPALSCEELGRRYFVSGARISEALREI